MPASAVDYYAALKKDELMPSAAAWMDPEMVTLNEVSWAEKDRCHMMSPKCGVLRNGPASLLMKQRHTHGQETN